MIGWKDAQTGPLIKHSFVITKFHFCQENNNKLATIFETNKESGFNVWQRPEVVVQNGGQFIRKYMYLSMYRIGDYNSKMSSSSGEPTYYVIRVWKFSGAKEE